MITIDVIALVNRILSFASGLSLGGLIVFCIVAKCFSKKILNFLITLALLVIVFWYLSDTGRIPEVIVPNISIS